MRKFDTIFLFLTIFVSGGVVLILEILGARIISPFYGSTIFVWTSMITVTLGALAVGYWLGGYLVDKFHSRQKFFWQVSLSGFSLLLPVKIDQWVLSVTDSFGLQYGPLVAALLLFFIPLLLLGTLTPTVIGLLVPDKKHSGGYSGKAFAISTVGSIVGGLLAGFVLLPSVGIVSTVTGCAVLLVILGLFGLLQTRSFPKKGNMLAVLLIIVISGISLPRITAGHKNLVTILEHRQSYLADIKVVDLRGYEYNKCLFVDGSGQTCIDDLGRTDGFFQRFLMSEIPDLNLGSESRILVLGLGGGGLLSFLPLDAEITVVELDDQVIDLAYKHFVLANYPNVKVVSDDARHYVSTAEAGNFDLVLENIALGNSVPYYILSSESFAGMKSLLKPNGVLLAHIGSHEIEGDKTFNEAVFSTAKSQFTNVLVFSSLKDQVANLVLYMAESPIDPEINSEAVLADLEYRPELIATDDKNPLEYLYLSNAFSQRENVIGLGKELFYVE